MRLNIYFPRNYNYKYLFPNTLKFYTDTKLKKDQLHNAIYKLKLFPKDLNRLRSDIHVAIQIKFLVK